MPQLPDVFEDSADAAAWFDAVIDARSSWISFRDPLSGRTDLVPVRDDGRGTGSPSRYDPYWRRTKDRPGYRERVGGVLVDPRLGLPPASDESSRHGFWPTVDTLPELTPPADGEWSPADTFQIARNGVEARNRAAAARTVATDPTAKADAQRAAAKDAERWDAYAADADAAVRASSAAWLPSLNARPAPAGATPNPRIGNW